MIFRSAMFGMAAIFLIALGLLARPDGAIASRPNFVVIQTDDQTLKSTRATFVDRGGKRRPVMPNLRKLLIGRGFEFRRAFTTTPLCAPSRASLLTGQYPHNTKLRGNSGKRGGWSGWEVLPIRDRNLAVALQQDGYRTIHIGKFTNDYRGRVGRGIQRGIPPGWNQWITVSDFFHRGMDRTRYYGYRFNRQGEPYGPFGGPRRDARGCSRGIFSRYGARRICGHLTDRGTFLATRQIRNSTRPFLLNLNYSSPHVEFYRPHLNNRSPNGPRPSVRHNGTAKRTPLPRPRAFNEQDLSDKPGFLRERLKRFDRREIRQMEVWYRYYLESLRGVDQGVRELVRTLRRVGKLRSTYIIFSSDNGLFFGEHRLGLSKFVPYQESVRVPLLIRGPGIPGGRTSRQPVSLIDVAPTIAGLADSDLGYRADGQGLSRFWKRPSRKSDRPLLLELGRSELTSPPTEFAVRRKAPFVSHIGMVAGRGRFKLIDYGRGRLELYDLKRDPHELSNLADRWRYRGIKSFLMDAMGRYSRCSGADCREDLIIPSRLIPRG